MYDLLLFSLVLFHNNHVVRGMAGGGYVVGRYVVLLHGKTVFLDVSPSDTKNIQSGASNSKKRQSYDSFKRIYIFFIFGQDRGV